LRSNFSIFFQFLEESLFLPSNLSAQITQNAEFSMIL
jgi:hypothetical protein